MKKKLDWLAKAGFRRDGAPRRPLVGEYYADKNDERVVYAYAKSALPCKCAACHRGVRQVVAPIAGPRSARDQEKEKPK